MHKLRGTRYQNRTGPYRLNQDTKTARRNSDHVNGKLSDKKIVKWGHQRKTGRIRDDAGQEERLVVMLE